MSSFDQKAQEALYNLTVVVEAMLTGGGSPHDLTEDDISIALETFHAYQEQQKSIRQKKRDDRG